jgi:hypothetical protein
MESARQVSMQAHRMCNAAAAQSFKDREATTDLITY